MLHHGHQAPLLCLLSPWTKQYHLGPQLIAGQMVWACSIRSSFGVLGPHQRVHTIAATDPQDFEVCVALGVLHHLGRQYGAAITSFEQALKLQPQDYSLWNKLGATLANNARRWGLVWDVLLLEGLGGCLCATLANNARRWGMGYGVEHTTTGGPCKKRPSK